MNLKLDFMQIRAYAWKIITESITTNEDDLRRILRNFSDLPDRRPLTFDEVEDIIRAVRQVEAEIRNTAEFQWKEAFRYYAE